MTRHYGAEVINALLPGKASKQLPFPVVIPLHQAVSQTLLTRPPLVSEAASCFLLPFDLHVLGLPPAFNLSHD
ncbi:hypothetical protein, partial [Enterobacter hormaechei]|uniref:hypothetical protein n=1 Tax=Enterobacter hormaechei TaxID=158836 RepID=UPI002A750839